jgi:lipopolysaccharide/colanic/teichoic acid biosynthesis glycosyltransferase
MTLSFSALEQPTDQIARAAMLRLRNQAIIRILDVTISSLAILFFLPLFVIISITLALQGAPIIFAHQRVGLGGRRFFCLKFRSMVVNAEARLSRLLHDDPRAREEWSRNQKLRNDPRITAFGHFLRRSSLDELPQLFNVLRGDMSIVGPRPIVDSEIYRYGHRFSNYCAVKPGITGLWQISGRNDVSYRRRVAMDSAYARSICPAFYLWIVLATVPAVLMRKGSY